MKDESHTQVVLTLGTCVQGFGRHILYSIWHFTGSRYTLYTVQGFIVQGHIATFRTSGFWPRVRARALRAPVFLSSLPPQTGRCAPPPPPSQLRCFSFDPHKYIKSIQLRPPTSKAFFTPLDHMQTAEAMKYEVPWPAHRSFADPYRNILGSKLCAGATIRPNFCRFFLFLYRFWIFSFCYSLLFIFLLFISFYPSLLISSLPFFVFLFFSSYILNCLLYYRHEISVILMGFLRGSSLC